MSSLPEETCFQFQSSDQSSVLKVIRHRSVSVSKAPLCCCNWFCERLRCRTDFWTFGSTDCGMYLVDSGTVTRYPFHAYRHSLGGSFVSVCWFVLYFGSVLCTCMFVVWRPPPLVKNYELTIDERILESHVNGYTRYLVNCNAWN